MVPVRPHRKEIYVFFIPMHQLGRGFQFPALNNWGKPPDSVHSSTLSLRHFQPWFPASQEGQARHLGPMFTLSVGFADFCGIYFSHDLLIFSFGAPPQPMVEKPPITCRKALTFTQKTLGLRPDNLELDIKSHTCLNHHLPRIFDLFNFQVVLLFCFFFKLSLFIFVFFNLISWFFWFFLVSGVQNNVIVRHLQPSQRISCFINYDHKNVPELTLFPTLEVSSDCYNRIP